MYSRSLSQRIFLVDAQEAYDSEAELHSKSLASLLGLRTFRARTPLIPEPNFTPKPQALNLKLKALNLGLSMAAHPRNPKTWV